MTYEEGRRRTLYTIKCDEAAQRIAAEQKAYWSRQALIRKDEFIRSVANVVWPAFCGGAAGLMMMWLLS